MVTKKIILLIAIIFSMNAFAQADAVKSDSEFDQEVELIVGLERILSFDFVPSNIIKIANESLVTHQFVPQKKQILLTGIKPGETSLTVRDQMGDVRKRFLLKITSSDQSKVLMQLRIFWEILKVWRLD